MSSLRLLGCFILLLSGCAADNRTDDIRKIVGKKMVIADYHLDGDSYKIVSYYDMRFCSSCRLDELARWKVFADSTKQKVKFIFVVRLKEDQKMETVFFDQHKFDKVVLFDNNGSFERDNLVPNPEFLRYFLLAPDNIIEAVGSPLNNPKMQKLYNAILSGTQK